MGGERFLLFQLQCFMWEMMKMESTDQNRLVQVPIVSASHRFSFNALCGRWWKWSQPIKIGRFGFSGYLNVPPVNRPTIWDCLWVGPAADPRWSLFMLGSVRWFRSLQTPSNWNSYPLSYQTRGAQTGHVVRRVGFIIDWNSLVFLCD